MHITTLTAVGLSFTWPDGTALLRDADLSLTPGLSSLVGDNGAGKTTLLEILAGLRTPAHGTVRREGRVALVRQESAQPGIGDLADGLGISATLTALSRIEGGSTDPADFEAIGDDWGLAARAVARLDRLGLPTDLERPLTSLSGGQFRTLALARALLDDPDVLLLDEPTNDLDAESRARLHGALDEFAGSVLTVSHDLELLDRAAHTFELRETTLRAFGGNYSHYRAVLEDERRTHAEQTAAAAAQLRREQRQYDEAQTALARRRRTAQKAQVDKRVPPIAAGLRASKAQVSAGKLERGQREAVDAARSELNELRQQRHLPTAPAIRLPSPQVASSAQIIVDPRLPVTGPERVLLSGPNGAGKSQLLASLTADEDAVAVPYVFVPQVISFNAPAETLARAAYAAAPDTAPEEVHALLARFGFTGRSSDRRLSELSGGERLRAALVLALLAQPDPKLLILDEPTNSLDVGTVESLIAALAEWPGALLVVSHDSGFTDRLSPWRKIGPVASGPGSAYQR